MAVIDLPKRSLVESGMLRQSRFRIPTEDPRILGKLYDAVISKIYTSHDRVLAELAQNAADEHRAAGVRTPWRVQLPTRLRPELVVEDFGRGMSPEFMFGPYAEVFRSTKDEDPGSVGKYGVGRLSALGVGDSFQVDTAGWLYDIRRDETGIPRVAQLCATGTSGTRVIVPVPHDKIDDLRRAAERHLVWYDPLPEGVALSRPEILFGSREKGWAFRRTGYGDHALLVEAGYAYPLALARLDDARLRDARGLVLFVEPGVVSVTTNRESLQYDDRTVATLRARLDKLAADLAAEVGAEILAEPTRLEALRAYQSALMSLPVRDLDLVYKGVKLETSFAGMPGFGKDYRGKPTVRYLDIRRRSATVAESCVQHRGVAQIPRHDRVVVADPANQPPNLAARLKENVPDGSLVLTPAQADWLELPADQRIDPWTLRAAKQARGPKRPTHWWRAGQRVEVDQNDLPTVDYFIRVDNKEPEHPWDRIREAGCGLLENTPAPWGIPKSASVPKGWQPWFPAAEADFRAGLAALGDVGRTLAIKAELRQLTSSTAAGWLLSNLPPDGGPYVAPLRRLFRLKAEAEALDLDVGLLRRQAEFFGIAIPAATLADRDSPARQAALLLERVPVLKLMRFEMGLRQVPDAAGILADLLRAKR